MPAAHNPRIIEIAGFRFKITDSNHTLLYKADGLIVRYFMPLR